MAQWIWRFGEFEIYHSMLVHSRRRDYDYPENPVWKVWRPEPVVRFSCDVDGEGGEFTVVSQGFSTVRLQGADGGYGENLRGEKKIRVPAGKFRISITVMEMESFPALYCDGYVETSGKWVADDLNEEARPVGTWDRFDSPEKTPRVFPFSYEKLRYTEKKELENGTLFVFARETFARTRFTFGADGGVNVWFGESMDEVMDDKWCVVRRRAETVNKVLSFDAQAFRYIRVDRKDVEVEAEYEYLDMPVRGAFRTGEEKVDRLWDIAAYTFHLNSREALLDGIKRDRWVWSGDAYQSCFVNRALFMDESLEQRTLVALAGKQPIGYHINTIMDYTFLWFMCLASHYEAFGNKAFLESIFPQAQAYMDFCLSRVSADGYMRGKKNDWIFIDWADLDKADPFLGEQILFARALRDWAGLCRAVGVDGTAYDMRATELEQAIEDDYYDDEKHAYIDSFASGRRFVSRHCNALAYLFLPLTEERKRGLYENVFLNDKVPAITTPYFKFYENCVMCEAGDRTGLEKSMREYYGSMLDTGATTLYEQYDPRESAPAIYAMYGRPFEKSLCHAWSTSPIYLLARYRAGVKQTSVGGKTFEVSPVQGDLGDFTCRVPLTGGSVTVESKGGKFTVTTDREGGTFVINGERIPLEKNISVTR